MTFNLGGAYAAAQAGEHAWSRRRALVSEVVRRAAPDVVAFQEFDQLHLDWLEHALPEYAGLVGLPGDTTEQPTFNAIAWRRGWRFPPGACSKAQAPSSPPETIFRREPFSKAASRCMPS